MSSTATAGLVAALAPLGAKYHIAILIAYDDSATNATITAHLRPKEGVKTEARHLQIAGDIASVEAQIATALPAAVGAIVRHVATLDSLAADLAAEEKAARDKAEADKKKAKPASTPAKPAAKPAAKDTGKKPAAPAAAAADDDDDENDSDDADTSAAPAPAASAPAAAGGKTAAENAILALNLGDDDPTL